MVWVTTPHYQIVNLAHADSLAVTEGDHNFFPPHYHIEAHFGERRVRLSNPEARPAADRRLTSYFDMLSLRQETT